MHLNSQRCTQTSFTYSTYSTINQVLKLNIYCIYFVIRNSNKPVRKVILKKKTYIELLLDLVKLHRL